MYRIKKPGVLQIARQRLSFLIASLSLCAFVAGNIVGQHGWYAFFRSVLGKGDDSVIAYVGMVPPIERVPDYRKWALYGGGGVDHTYKQVPQDLLVPLPAYDPVKLKNEDESNLTHLVYSVGNLGSYSTGEDHGGSHVGVDIRVPQGTPIHSVANGIVEKVSMQSDGYGHHVMIRHPNVPDPGHPGQLTTVYSIYAHLDVILVTEGEVVYKGQNIALSGQTGFASGPHLHFQMDKASSPFRPYWPFTTQEATQAHLSFTQAIDAGLHQERGELYTWSPLLFVQTHLDSTNPVRIASAATSAPGASVLSEADRIKQLRTQRISQRKLAAADRTVTVLAQPAQVISQVVTAEVQPSVLPIVSASSNTDVDHLELVTSGKMNRTWQKVQIRAVDHSGQPVTAPSFVGRVYVISDFGQAEIRPNELTADQFVNGVATVNVLTRGTKTTFIATRGAFSAVSGPMVHER